MTNEIPKIIKLTDENYYSIYTITNLTNDKVYVGQAKNVSKRWSDHKRAAKLNKPTQTIHHALIKYGLDSFEFKIIATCKNQDDANEIETFCVNQYDSYKNGYNATHGGMNAPKTPEWIEKVRQKAIERAPVISQQMSEIASNRSEDYYDYMKGNTINSGRLQSQEWKEMIKACNNTEAAKAKKSATLKEAYASGRRVSAQKGKPAHNKGKKGPTSPNKTKWTNEQIEIIKNDNRSSYKIAVDYNVSASVIQKLRKELGIAFPKGNTKKLDI